MKEVDEAYQDRFTALLLQLENIHSLMKKHNIGSREVKSWSRVSNLDRVSVMLSVAERFLEGVIK